MIGARKDICLFQNSQTHIISISASFDRTVYPLKSKLYVRVNCQDIIFGKNINLEILNSDSQLIDSKQIDPISHPDSELKQAGIYQESFKMNDSDWKVGETYTIRASHGNAIAESTCVVDERTPVIQTDNSVYPLGSVMILTVIDPDAVKDSQKPEFVGNSSESFLTISSSIGKLEGYKLKETGNSTGIFQGVIGFTKNLKTQGIGTDDGYLQVKENDEIKIIYKRKSDITTLIAYTSN